MGHLIELEMVNGIEQSRAHGILCVLPFGSASVCNELLNDKLEGPAFRNALKLLAEEVKHGVKVAEVYVAMIRGYIASLCVDVTRLEILKNILNRLLGDGRAQRYVSEWLEAENVTPEGSANNLMLLNC